MQTDYRQVWVRLANRAERSLRRIRQGDPRGYERIKTALRSHATNPARRERSTWPRAVRSIGRPWSRNKGEPGS